MTRQPGTLVPLVAATLGFRPTRFCSTLLTTERAQTGLPLVMAATLLFWSTFPSPAPAADFPTGVSSASVAVGDFDGDGRLDLAVANNGSDDVSVLLGNGDGTFQPAVNYPVGEFPWSVAVGDFDGDGRLDLAVATLVPTLSRCCWAKAMGS